MYRERERERCIRVCIYIYIYTYHQYVYVYIYIYIHGCIGTVDFRNFIVFVGPRTWHIEIRHRVKKNIHN